MARVTAFSGEENAGHGAGAAALALDATRCFTGGADGTLRARNLEAGAGVEREIEAEAPQTCLALLRPMNTKSAELFVGSDDGSVQVLPEAGGVLQLRVRTSPAPVLALDLLAQGKYLIMASADSTLRVRDVTNRYEEVCTLSAPSQAAFRGLAVDPKSRYLAALDNENKLHLWEVDFSIGGFSADHVAQKHINFDTKDREAALHPAFRGDGGILAVPGGETRDVHLYRRSDLEAAARDARGKAVAPSDMLSPDGPGHKGDVTAVAWSRNGRYLASGCTGGVVMIWDVDNLEEVRVFEDAGGEGIAQLAWLVKDGSNAIAVVTSDGLCAFLKEAVPADKGLPGPTDAVVAASPEPVAPAAGKRETGKHAANRSSASSGKPPRTDTTRPVEETAAETLVDDDDEMAAATQLDPNADAEDAVDDVDDDDAMVDGSDDVVVGNADDAVGHASNTMSEDRGSPHDGPPGKEKKRLQRASVGGDLEDSDDEDAALLAAGAETDAKPKLEHFIADEASDNDDGAADEAGSNDDALSSDDEDNSENAGGDGAIPEAPAAAAAPAAAVGSVAGATVAPGTAPQPPFMPSAAPLGIARRFLCWNAVGSIVSRQEDTHHAIEIEFSDMDQGRSQRFADQYGFSVAALSSRGAAFATFEEKGEEELEQEALLRGESALAIAQRRERREAAGHSVRQSHRSIVHYRPFQGYGGAAQASWTLSLPPGESAVLVAAGGTFVACATNQGLLRLFGTSGLQEAPIGLPGPVVALAAQNDSLAVAYHATSPVGTSQQLRLRLLDCATGSLVMDAPLALGPGATLSWLGFGPHDAVFAYDTDGRVLGLQRRFGGSFASLGRHKRHWPVCVTEGRVLAVALRPGDAFPNPQPRPSTVGLALGPVLLQGAQADVAATARLGAALLAEFHLDARKADRDRQAVLGGDDEEKAEACGEATAKLDRAVVRLIDEALQGERVGRAAELARRLCLFESHTVAIRIANHHGHASLAQTIEDRRDAKFSVDDDDDASDADSDADSDAESDADSDEGVACTTGAQQRRRPAPSVTPQEADESSGASSDEAGDESEGEAENVAPKTLFGAAAKRRTLGSRGPNRKLFSEPASAATKPPFSPAAAGAASSMPANPFASSMLSPARQKRSRSAVENIKSLAQSPSPSKKPMLSRQSSFSQQARNKSRPGVSFR